MSRTATSVRRVSRRQQFISETGLSEGASHNYIYAGTREIDLQLTPYVLSHAKKDDCRHCLIALALEIAINKPDQHILPIIDAMTMRWTEDDARYIMHTPVRAASLIADYDAGKRIEPQTLHVVGDVWQKSPAKLASDRKWHRNHPHSPRTQRSKDGKLASNASAYGSIPGDRLVKQRYIERGLESPHVQP